MWGMRSEKGLIRLTKSVGTEGGSTPPHFWGDNIELSKIYLGKENFIMRNSIAEETPPA